MIDIFKVNNKEDFDQSKSNPVSADNSEKNCNNCNNQQNVNQSTSTVYEKSKYPADDQNYRDDIK